MLHTHVSPPKKRKKYKTERKKEKAMHFQTQTHINRWNSQSPESTPFPGKKNRDIGEGNRHAITALKHATIASGVQCVIIVQREG